jgi:hypothetical protein
MDVTVFVSPFNLHALKSASKQRDQTSAQRFFPGLLVYEPDHQNLSRLTMLQNYRHQPLEFREVKGNTRIKHVRSF